MSYIKGFLLNMQFFTSIPIPLSLPMDKGHLERAVRTFPLLGLFQGAVYSALLYILVEWSSFSILTAAFAVWLAGIILTGGIHIDGWMDASDAYFSFRDKEKRLEIMSDPRTGAFGALSVIVLLSSRFFFIYEIVARMSGLSYFLIACIPIFSRAVMGVLLTVVKGAKEEGLGQLFQQSTTKYTLYAYPLYLFFPLAGYWATNQAVSFIFMVLATLAILFYLRHKIPKWFGGMTGDVLGASVEGTELLLWMTLWLLHYFVMG
ncbi:cobalamin biosynthesis protein CobS [Mesobacillus campisalis]|uniref:Adenosylcobinamide-GDP ribazoletransferase n=1 Tax=Mesobacillus campisalis TaxID=1408103 RepID=A0A0M2SVG5_9BACI|nr:adenosylcobinamide-GDP ribazoletransferase [Mesobacillus campisalis]KKK38559.1 cobalamin biosynthesis protein CobS [Mesobacillus campisalis]